MKLTKKQIEIIREQTPAELRGTRPFIIQTLGYFMPSGANWSYIAGFTFDGVLVVTRYGAVV